MCGMNGWKKDEWKWEKLLGGTVKNGNKEQSAIISEDLLTIC